MDSYGVRRKDTTKGPPLRVLSLDGGGVRGYSMFIIIQEIMHRTFVEIEGRAPRRHEIPKPCDHFDLIVGTGTGGLIALMLGRLRLDLETCKELYVRMTRHVFETDKTIAGIPYRSTLFKASKLEDAIRQAVQEHTVTESEGNDGALTNPLNAAAYSSAGRPQRNASNASTVSFSARSPSAQVSRPALHSRYGNPNARLYDARENRTKTAVTAVYKGSPRGEPAAVLRSYDSRKEPPPEFDCKIWQAGRATCAIGLAFKPVQVGQSVFHDDGVGTFNPSPEALDEAVVNEWPGRDVGVFISLGTGRRPKGSDANSHIWYEGFLGEYAEARRKLIAKIEGCETIHEYMVREHLPKRNVNIENYYRLNVEIGVGEFGMNEWNRLGEISTGTRRYMSREVEQKMLQSLSSKMARIYKAKIRFDRAPRGVPEIVTSTSSNTFESPIAVELPGDMPTSPVPPRSPPSRSSFDSGSDNLHLPGKHAGSPRSSNERIRPGTAHSENPPLKGQWSSQAHLPSSSAPSLHNEEGDKEVLTSPMSPKHYQDTLGSDMIAIVSPDEYPRPQPLKQAVPTAQRIEPPPLPPKTPLPSDQKAGRRPPAVPPPYPIDDDEEPPPVNMARKPNFRAH